MNDIQWTFGIITVYEDKQRLQEIIESIRNLNIPEYEILFVGGGDSSEIDGEDIRKIDFDESDPCFYHTNTAAVGISILGGNMKLQRSL